MLKKEIELKSVLKQNSNLTIKYTISRTTAIVRILTEVIIIIIVVTITRIQ